MGAAAVTAFVVFGAAARAAHPGASHTSTTAAATASTDDTSQSSFDFGQSSLGASSTETPSAQSSGS